jgi:uncharacterized membrane protein YhaH (DUF805 family)
LLLRTTGQAMDWGSLFFKFSGRINRAKFWIAALIYSGINVILNIIGYATDQNAVFQALNGMIGLVILISSLAVGIKRLHDRNKSGWYLLFFYVVPGILVMAAIGTYLTMEDGTLIAAVLGLASAAVGIWAFIELGCLRGTVGGNPYGPDPIAPAGVAPARNPV